MTGTIDPEETTIETDETAAVTTEIEAGTAVETATTTGIATGGGTTEIEGTATATTGRMTARSQHHMMRSSRCWQLAAAVRKTGTDETATTTATTTDEIETAGQDSPNGRSRRWACSQHMHCLLSRKRAQSIWRTRWAEVGSGARNAEVELYDYMVLRHSHLTSVHWTISWLIRTNASKHLCFFLCTLSTHGRLARAHDVIYGGRQRRHHQTLKVWGRKGELTLQTVRNVVRKQRGRYP
jgi:hypothetical protein